MVQFDQFGNRVNARHMDLAVVRKRWAYVRLRSKNRNDEAFPYLWIHRVSRKAKLSGSRSRA